MYNNCTGISNRESKQIQYLKKPYSDDDKIYKALSGCAMKKAPSMYEFAQFGFLAAIFH